MAEFVITVASKVAEYLVAPMSHEAAYLFRFKQFIGRLEKAKQELEVKLADVKKRKEESDRKTEEIMPSVKKWLDDVNAVLKEVQKLEQELEGGGNKCFTVSLRYSLAKQMEDKAQQMMKLKENSHFEPFSQLMIQLPINYSSKGFVDFNSRKSSYKRLLEAITDGKNKMVGLYGMGGLGKTTLAIKVAHEVIELKLFDNFVMVVVSKTPDAEKIQQEMAEQIGLELKEKLPSKRAERLSFGLKNKKILIILDNVWEELNLAEIGIPLNKGCCILLTTRLLNVCSCMECDSIIEMSLLTEEEAWALFKMCAYTTNDSMNEFDRIGRKIVHECKGLPIAIVTVGSTLKRKSIQVWRSTLGRLQHPPQSDIEDHLKAPYEVLEASYDNLLSPLGKSLFLLCSMFPEDHEIHIEDLIRFGKGALKLGDNIYTMEEARIEILVAIEKLCDSCLLMHTKEHTCVKLHHVVRDVALWVAKKHHQGILVDSRAVSNMISSRKSFEGTKALSLWNLEKNFKLSKRLHCPKLEILLLQPRGSIKDIEAIEALKVLALITYGFQWSLRPPTFCSISQSIGSSKNLRTLCLRGKRLDDISFLNELKGLEILDLRGSQFDELPAGIADMKMLVLLDMYGCKVKKSPLKIIGRCEKLEELYFWDKKSNIPKKFSVSGLKRYVIYDSICSFSNISAPFLEYLDSFDEALRALCIQGFKVSTLNSSMKDLILRANCLWLEDCKWDHRDINFEIEHLVVSCCEKKRSIIGNLETQQVFSHLITLRLVKMNSLEQVCQDSSLSYSLPMLQVLCIERCPELRGCIFTHATTVPSLPKLRKVKITYCNKVKWLLSYSLAFHCPSLEEIRIINCSRLEGLIDGETSHGDPPLDDMQHYPCGNETDEAYVGVTANSFNQLQNQQALRFFLSLKVLNITRSGRSKKGLFEVQIRGRVEDDEEKSSKTLEHENERETVLDSELRFIFLKDLQELEYIWKGPTQSVRLHRLERVTLRECARLKSIFTLTTITILPELRKLIVEECNEWEGILCEESLKTLSHSSSSFVCFPRLKIIRIYNCCKVTRLFSYYLASHCPSLVEITIHDCSELEELVQAYYEGEEVAGHELFPQLTDLDLKDLPKLREVYPDYEFNPKTDTIKGCPNIHDDSPSESNTSSSESNTSPSESNTSSSDSDT